MEAIGLLRFCSMILAVLVQPVCSSSCLASLSPQLRKDCHPDPGASEASCLARDCCWSPWKTPGIPWCFEKADSCSIVPDSQRIDCHPEAGANEAACVKRGCHWCASENSTAPFCFYNSKEEAACSTIVPIQKRVDCHPQPGASQEICEAKGCVWCSTTIANIPWCFYPADGPHGYTLKDGPQKTAQGWRLTLNKHGTISLFGNDISPVVMDVEFHTKDRLRFKIYDPNNKRFEVPLNIESSANVPVETDYDVEFVNDTVLQFRVIRKKTRAVLWETTLGGLIFSDQYIQMMTAVPSTSIYGFGEHEHPSFKHDMNYVRYGMFSRDQSPGAFSNLYGVHPFYMCIEKDFNAHGVLLLNSNAQDVTLSPFPSLTFRTIGGILDFYVFLGPTPENVIQQYTENVIITGELVFLLPVCFSYKSIFIHTFARGTPLKGKLYLSLLWVVLERLKFPMQLVSVPCVTLPRDTAVCRRRSDTAHAFSHQQIQVTDWQGEGCLPLQLKRAELSQLKLNTDSAIGRPFMPPYWSLGFQLSRWGYNSIDVLEKTVERLRQYDIPHDVQYGDIDLMERQLDFTYDRVNFAGLPEYIKKLKNDGLHYVIILDPFLTKDEPQGTYKPYELGQELGIWVNNSDGVTPAVGKAWPPGESVYPDYTNPKTAEWWIQMCMEFKNILDYDGIWIDMNEPSNFQNGQQPGCEENHLNYPPYVPDITGGLLAEKTLCPSSKTYLGYHYDTHSLFGWSQAKPTFYASQNATGKRAFVLSRSTFVGSGKYTGHWLGDNFSRWRDMHMSIIGMLEFNLFGIPYIGADICGFNEETTYELCLRWMQLGAFYPFSRNHNAIGHQEQDPGVFGEEFAAISRSALRIRYSLLPYLYTLFYHSHVSGNTVVRGLMHEFTSDPQTHEIDRAFLWGPALMIAPVLEEGARSVYVYFPEASWFDFYTGKQVSPSWLKKSVEVPAPLDVIPLFIRGGYILPTQFPARTTVLSRLNPFSLIIALDEQGEASGSLFWDDGDSIDSIEREEYFYAEYKFSNRTLKTTVINNGYHGITALEYSTVQILGFTSKPNVIFMNGETIPSSRMHYNSNGKITLQISAPLFQELTISFGH